MVCLDEDENGSDAELQAALKASLTEQGAQGVLPAWAGGAVQAQLTHALAAVGVTHKPGAWVWCQGQSTRVFAQVLQCLPCEQVLT